LEKEDFDDDCYRWQAMTMLLLLLNVRVFAKRMGP
jgi:hypothetical protein